MGCSCNKSLVTYLVSVFGDEVDKKVPSFSIISAPARTINLWQPPLLSNFAISAQCPLWFDIFSTQKTWPSFLSFLINFWLNGDSMSCRTVKASHLRAWGRMVKEKMWSRCCSVYGMHVHIFVCQVLCWRFSSKVKEDFFLAIGKGWKYWVHSVVRWGEV